MDSIVPIEFDITTHKVIDERQLNKEDSQLVWLQHLEQLEEDQELALAETHRQQLKWKKAYDKKLK